MNYFKASKFFLFIAPLAVVLVTISTLFPFIVGKYSWFRTSVDLALVFFLLGLLFQDRESSVIRRLSEIFRRPLVIAVTVFAAVFLLACFFGVDPAYSIWSGFERGEGGFQILHLWMFFMLAISLFNEDRDWRRLFGWVVISGVLSGAYGLLAGWGVKGFIGPLFSDSGFRFYGSIGNPAYSAAFAIFLMFYVVYLLYTNYRNRLKSIGAVPLYLAGIGFLAMFFAAATRGAFIGLVVAVLAFLAYFIYSHISLRKYLLIAGAAVIIVVGSLIFFQNTPFVESIPGSRIFDISVTARTFEDRAIMWGIAWNGFKERPLLGWGPENFIQVFDRHFDINYFKANEGFGAWFDRAHSIYFDYLAEIGALGLLSFLAVFMTFYWSLFKSVRTGTNKEPPFVNALLLGLSLAYLVQGLVLFDVLVIYINIFILLAFGAYIFKKPNPR
ncbi:O-antigen ligase domain-containing protein [bacterium]|nr:MAG: O-antigen ligase domain-containing protein [bacterium]